MAENSKEFNWEFWIGKNVEYSKRGRRMQQKKKGKTCNLGGIMIHLNGNKAFHFFGAFFFSARNHKMQKFPFSQLSIHPIILLISC
jgi:hypothetical protein